MKTFLEFLNEVRLTNMQGDWQGENDVNWAVIEDHIRSIACEERRKYNSCHHPKCKQGTELAALAHVYDMDRTAIDQEGIDRIINYLASTTCYNNQRTGRCRHAACGKHNYLINWVEKQKKKTAA